MKSDEQLIKELKEFSTQFLDNNLFSYEDGGYSNGLGNFDIDEVDWDNSSDLRRQFEDWINSNGFANTENTSIGVNFETSRIRIFGLVREIK
jgi:hypothetical protein